MWFLLSLLKVKAQSGEESMKTAVKMLRNPLCGFYDPQDANSLVPFD